VILLKERLDVLLVKKGLFATREKAKASIMAGLILVEGQIADKAGTQIKEDATITIKENLCPYVSRGGLKLEKAIDLFKIDLNGYVCMDIGASTGGFTDCMLKNGAIAVYAIDVGYGQLDWKLRNDSRVVNYEKTNIRYFDTKPIENKIDFISIDVSFISLKLVFPVVSKVLKEKGSVLCLVKPQFEAGREQVGKRGIIRDSKIHAEVIKKVIGYARENLLEFSALTYSPIKGAKGNIEFLLYLKNDSDKSDFMTDKLINECVDMAHRKLAEVEE